jgi:CRP/FNR family cyclic AMP-dependent transcriptional regulator
MARRWRKSEKMELLAGVPLFANLSQKDLNQVAGAADEVDFSAGKYLGRQGETGQEAFVVTAGSLDIRRNGRKVAMLGPGAVVGEMALIDGAPRSADIVAHSDGSALVMHRKDFGGLLDGSAAFQRKILLAVTQRLREADRRLYG